MTVTLLLLACGCRLWRLSITDDCAESRSRSSHRFAHWLLAGCVTIVTAWMVHDRFGPARASSSWDRYQRMARVADMFDVQTSLSDAAPAAGGQMKLPVQPAIHLLERIVRWEPDQARAHARLGAAYLTAFNQAQRESANDLDVDQVRDAVEAAGFASARERDAWLERSLGANHQWLDRGLWHVRRSLELAPLLGDSYVRLASLCFLRGGGPADRSACVRQALAVRPYDGKVLFEAGKEAMLAGDEEQTLYYWRQCFKRGGGDRRRIIEILVGHVPARFFIEEFQPDLSGVRDLCRFYRQAPPEAGYQQLLALRAEMALSSAEGSRPEQAGAYWLEAHQAFRALVDVARAEHCAQRALDLSPEQFDTHMAMGDWRMEQGAYADAERHFKWCSRRRPDDSRVQDRLLEAVKRRLDGTLQSVTPGVPPGSSPGVPPTVTR
jgi:tetratricopeptide (TPR) repeat protein